MKFNNLLSKLFLNNIVIAKTIILFIILISASKCIKMPNRKYIHLVENNPSLLKKIFIKSNSRIFDFVVDNKYYNIYKKFFEISKFNKFYIAFEFDNKFNISLIKKRIIKKPDYMYYEIKIYFNNLKGLIKSHIDKFNSFDSYKLDIFSINGYIVCLIDKELIYHVVMHIDNITVYKNNIFKDIDTNKLYEVIHSKDNKLLIDNYQTIVNKYISASLIKNIENEYMFIINSALFCPVEKLLLKEKNIMANTIKYFNGI